MQDRSQQTVDVILEAAALVLEQGGFDAYNTNTIAERAGVSIGSIYQYFAGKDGLTVALIERETAALVGEVRDALQTPAIRTGLLAVIAIAVQHQWRRPSLAKLLDFEQQRLAIVMPRSGNAAAIRGEIARFLSRTSALDDDRADGAARDVMAITRTLTDAAAERGTADIDQLRAQIEGAVFGYLQAML